MLPQAHRLPGHRLPVVLRSPQIFHSPLFTLKLINRSDTKPSRISFVVSTKISKKAVTRNRLKRLLRQATHTYLNQLKPGYDLVILAKPTLKNQPLTAIISALSTSFHQAQLLTHEAPSF